MSKHLTLSDRIKIAAALELKKPMNQIAAELGKDCSTISREIRRHSVAVDKAAFGRIKNRCVYRYSCKLYGICENEPDCTRKCSTCSRCNANCSSFAEEKCRHLSAPPYVCNGCDELRSCVLMKAFYYADQADRAYRQLLSESRQGYNMTTLELRNIDAQLSPLIKNGQSIHAAFVAKGGSVTVSESTVARLIKDSRLRATVMDQQRAVKLKPRKSKPTEKKVDRRCREGRSYQDYLLFLEQHPGLSAIEMDSVIGRIGGKSLLTMIFPASELMLAFLCECHTAACVQTKIDCLYDGLGELFTELFPLILTDNGSEFSDPLAIETDSNGKQRTRLFYCDAMASWQKPHVERNHEYIRLILPKGSSFDVLTQENIGLMMSHINSYPRASLGDRSPFEVFAYLHGQSTLDKLSRLVCQTKIDSEKIVLKPSLLR